ncbi:MAG: hypothetical protein IJR69_06765 [Bacteroidaceae bacterium]|jgi:hypothetical protein|nr:hypothetical protein [Bacteroidaceae bacterium]
MDEQLKPYMKPLAESEYPEPCRKCKFRHLLRWLLGQKFCEHSSYTCTKRTKPCDEFEEIDRQLTFNFDF